MHKSKRAKNKHSNSSAPQKPPSPPPTPPIEGDKEYEGGDDGGNGGGKTNYAEKPPHWTIYVEAACAVLLVIITAFYTHYAFQQAQSAITAAGAAKSAAETASQDLVVSQRAWISLTPDIIGPLTFDQNGASLPMYIEMRNVGHSPARYVKPWVELEVGLAPPSDEQIEAACAMLKKSPVAEQTNGWTLFPDQTGKQLYPASAPSDEIEAGMNQGIPGKVGLNLIVCADYTMTFGGHVHHQTRQSYFLGWRDPAHNGMEMGAFDPHYPTSYPVDVSLRIGGFAD